MKKSNKAIITFVLATFTPPVTWIVFLPLAFFTMVLLNPTSLGPENLNLATKLVRFLVLVVMVYIGVIPFSIFVFAFSFMHMLFLGIPSFAVANRLGMIRWYTVLPASFFIGSAPYILFTLGSPKDVVLAVTTIMGIFGFSAGVVLWLLWRYWVSPETHAKVDASIATLVPYE
jgi:hypothetical protein